MSKKENAQVVGNVLVDKGFISATQLEAALSELSKGNRFICSVIEQLGFAKEADLLKVVAEQFNIPFVKIKDILIQEEVLRKIPARFASHYKVIPIEFENNTLTVAMRDPLDVHTLDDIRSFLDVEVRGVLSLESEIEGAIASFYGVGADTLDTMLSQGAGLLDVDQQSQVQDISAQGEKSIILLVNQIMREAVKERATDIHLEPFDDGLRARFRIDGVLYNVGLSDKIDYFYPQVVSRIKIMADLNIAERRMPQDGRIKIKIEGRELDLRISIIPTGFGEAVHIRVLSPSFFLELGHLGLCDEDRSLIEEAIQKPHGIILVTGPTGSGKSTTLYAALAKINSTGKKIITIEDPVEYQLKGVIQMQVLSKIGLSFSQGLRHLLRHDPDIMMIGEIRDFETAEISIRAALTGHLVFSTLHTNDAVGAVARLLDMGIENYLVASSLQCLVAQRLVRTICTECAHSIEATQEIQNKMKKCGFDAVTHVREGKGCKLCRNTGYRGRTGIYEVIQVLEPIREMILSRSLAQKIKQKALSLGMRPLLYDGFKKVSLGVTTVEEVLRVSQEEE